jgi:hypothetical protein
MLWQATTATKTAMVMVITALIRAQIQNRRRPEIIMVGRRVAITRITPRIPLQPRGQTFRRLRHHPVRRRPARRWSLRLHLPQHRKRQRKILLGAAAKRFRCRFCFRPTSEARNYRFSVNSSVNREPRAKTQAGRTLTWSKRQHSIQRNAMLYVTHV